MDPISILSDIKQNLLDFVTDLMIILPNETDLRLFYVFIEHQIPMVDVARYIAKNIVPLKKKVKDRDEDYFKENAVLFEKLGEFECEVNRFKMLWDSNPDEENRNMVWLWLEKFVELGESYRKLFPKDKKKKE